MGGNTWWPLCCRRDPRRSPCPSPLPAAILWYPGPSPAVSSSRTSRRRWSTPSCGRAAAASRADRARDRPPTGPRLHRGSGRPAHAPGPVSLQAPTGPTARTGPTTRRQRPEGGFPGASSSGDKSAIDGCLKNEPPCRFRGGGLDKSGSVLLSHTVSRAVPSAMRGLTSVFGMGTGGTPSPKPPETCSGPRGTRKSQSLRRKGRALHFAGCRCIGRSLRGISTLASTAVRRRLEEWVTKPHARLVPVS